MLDAGHVRSDRGENKEKASQQSGKHMRTRLTVWIQCDKIAHTTSTICILYPDRVEQRSGSGSIHCLCEQIWFLIGASLVWFFCVIRAWRSASPHLLSNFPRFCFTIPIITYPISKFPFSSCLFFSRFSPTSSESISMLKTLSSLFYRWYHSEVVT